MDQLEEIKNLFISQQGQLGSLEGRIEDLKQVVIDINQQMLRSFKIVDQNFEALDKKIDTVDKKVDILISESNQGFEKVGGQLNELQEEVSKIQKVSNYSQEYENLLKISK